MTDQEIDIGQVLPGPCCGRYVPEPDEIERVLAGLGIERTNQHPEFTLESEEDFEHEGPSSRASSCSRAWETAWISRMGPRATSRHTQALPSAIAAHAPAGKAYQAQGAGIVCATYRNHGRTGQTWGVDIMVAPFKQKANAPQKALGNALVRWLMNNWVEMHLNYVIWWNRMNDGAGWFDYSPWSKPASQGGYPGGSPDMNTRRHEDHVHIQVMNPNRGPNQ